MSTNVSPKTGPLDLALVTLVTVLLGSPGCRMIGGAIKAGVWLGVLGLAVLLVLALGLMRMLKPR